MLRRLFFPGLVLFLLSSLLLTGAGCKRGPTLVKVGGTAITDGDLDLLGRVNPKLKPRLATPSGKQKVLENYVEQELLYQESQRRGLDRSKMVREKIDLYKKIIVAQALLDDELDKKVKEYYQNNQDEFERVKISHIMIRTSQPEEKADAKKKDKKKEKKKGPQHPETEALKLVENVRDRLAKGEDFAKVAKEVSEDERTKNNGGDLGAVTLRDKRLERWGWLPLAEKAFAMKVGEFSDAIKTKEGFHVIRVTEEKKLQPLEEAEAGIRFRLQADIRNDLLGNLKKKYKVEYAKAETKKAPVAAPETAPASPAGGATPESEGVPPQEAPPAAPPAP